MCKRKLQQYHDDWGVRDVEYSDTSANEWPC